MSFNTGAIAQHRNWNLFLGRVSAAPPVTLDRIFTVDIITGAVYFSDDNGVIWSAGTGALTAPVDVTGWGYGAGGLFYLNGQAGAPSDALIYSSDGDAAPFLSTINTNAISAMATDGALRMLVVDDNGIPYTSDDGIAWSAGASLFASGLLCLNYVNDRFAVSTFTNVVRHSANGVAWSTVAIGADGAATFVIVYCAAAGVWLALPTNYTAQTLGYASSDFVNWNSFAASNQFANVTPFANGVGAMCAVSSDGIFYSDDGASLTLCTGTGGVSFNGIVFNNGEFVASNSDGDIWRSADGITFALTDSVGSAPVNPIMLLSPP